MGCFNYICSATLIPIKEDDKVVLFVCQSSENQQSELQFNYMTKISYPIFGKYDDYGSIKSDFTNPMNVDFSNENNSADFPGMFYSMVHQDAYDELINYKRISEEQLVKLFSQFKEKKVEGIARMIQYYQKRASEKGGSLSEERKNDIKEEYEIKLQYDVDMLLRSSIEFIRNEDYGFNTYLAFMQSGRDIQMNVIKILNENDLDGYLTKIKPVIDQLTFIYNMDSIGRKLEVPNFGRQTEEYDLYRRINMIGLKQMEQSMVDSYLFIDIPVEQYDKNKNIILSKDNILKFDPVIWNDKYTDTEFCETGFIRVMISPEMITDFEVVINQENKKAWDKSPKQLVDALNLLIPIQLKQDIILPVRKPDDFSWIAYNDIGEEISNTIESDKKLGDLGYGMF